MDNIDNITQEDLLMWQDIVSKKRLTMNEKRLMLELYQRYVDIRTSICLSCGTQVSFLFRMFNNVWNNQNLEKYINK